MEKTYTVYAGVAFIDWCGLYDKWYFDKRTGDFISLDEIVKEYFDGEWWGDSLLNYINYLTDNNAICDLETARRILNEQANDIVSSWNRECEKMSDDFDECESVVYDFKKMTLWEHNYSNVFNAFIEQMGKCDMLIKENK